MDTASDKALQHFAELIATGKYQNLIPNVHVRDIENVGEYLVDINNVGTSWDKKDVFGIGIMGRKSNIWKKS